MNRSEQSERRLDGGPQKKLHRDSLNSFLGYHATGQNELEGVLRATETSCVPLLENQALTILSQVLFCLWGTLGELENSEFCLDFRNFQRFSGIHPSP